MISLNNQGDLTYPYDFLDGKTQTIKDIIENNHQISKKILNSNKPMVVLGESFFTLKSADYLFNSLKEFLHKNNKFKNDWNPLNILTTDAGTVGNFDLDILNNDEGLINDLNNNKFEIVFLIGQDNLKFKKNNEFVIYLGSHGDKGAEAADIILPGAAYTEQSGHYTKLEGKIQKSFKASYPPGEAKEDWQIINELAELMNNRTLFNDKEELQSSMFNYLNIKKEKQKTSYTYNKTHSNFINEFLEVKFKDYYFSNVIARSSKTMLDCNNAKQEIKLTGTEG